MWAPSSIMDERSFNVVVHHLLVGGADAVENKCINQVMIENVCSPTSPTQPNPPSHPSFLVPVAANTLFKEKMLHFGNKEAGGIPLLGIFVVEVAQHFSILKGVDFKADMEFHSGSNTIEYHNTKIISSCASVHISLKLLDFSNLKLPPAHWANQIRVKRSLVVSLLQFIAIPALC